MPACEYRPANMTHAIIASSNEQLHAALLHQAASTGDLANVQHFLKELQGVGNVADVVAEPFAAASQNNRSEVVHYLLPLVDKATLLTTGPNGSLPPLHFFACYGETRVLECILQQFTVDNLMNCKDTYGMTCLHWAAWCGQLQFIQALCKQPGLDPSCVTKHSMPTVGARGLTPLHLAACKGSISLVEEISTTYTYAVTKIIHRFRSTIPNESDYMDIARLLIFHGASLQKTDSRRNTPLHYAAMARFYPAVELLVQSGADGAAKNIELLTPLSIVEDHAGALDCPRLAAFAQVEQPSQPAGPIGSIKCDCPVISCNDCSTPISECSIDDHRSLCVLRCPNRVSGCTFYHQCGTETVNEHIPKCQYSQVYCRECSSFIERHQFSTHYIEAHINLKTAIDENFRRGNRESKTCQCPSCGILYNPSRMRRHVCTIGQYSLFDPKECILNNLWFQLAIYVRD